MAWRNARLVGNRRKLLLVFREIEASVKRGPLNQSLVFLLNCTNLIDNDIGIVEVTIHQVVVTNKARTVFKY